MQGVDPELVELANEMHRIARKLEFHVDDSEDGTDVSGWVHAIEMLHVWASILVPPQTSWPPNVTPISNHPKFRVAG